MISSAVRGVAALLLLSSVFAVPGYAGRTTSSAAGPLADGLVAYYPLDENSGDAVDLHTGGHTLTQMGVVDAAAGHVYPTARSFAYAGATGGAHFESGAPELRPTGDTTIAVWYRLTAMPAGSYPDLYRHIWGQCGWDGGMTLLMNGAGELAFQTSRGDGLYETLHIPAPGPLLDAWHLAVFWYDSSSLSLGGQADAGAIGRWPALGALPGPVLPGTNRAVLGAGNAAGREAWDGQLGPVMLWSRLLSADEKALLYNGGRGLTYQELVAQPIAPAATSTPTSGATATVTPAFTPGVTPSPTATVTPQPETTPALTGTATPEPTAVSTQLATATTSPTTAPTQTATASPTATPTQTATVTPSPTQTATVTPSPTAALTQTGTPTAAPTSSPTVTGTPTPARTIHVADLDRAASRNSNRWSARVTILVHDDAETPMAGAVVSGRWSGGATGATTCTTNSAGFCSVSKNSLAFNSVASVSWSASDLSLAGYSYAPSRNHDPDGDSDGTTIVILRP